MTESLGAITTGNALAVGVILYETDTNTVSCGGLRMEKIRMNVACSEIIVFSHLLPVSAADVWQGSGRSTAEQRLLHQLADGSSAAPSPPPPPIWARAAPVALCRSAAVARPLTPRQPELLDLAPMPRDAAASGRSSRKPPLPLFRSRGLAAWRPGRCLRHRRQPRARSDGVQKAMLNFNEIFHALALKSLIIYLFKSITIYK
ncbi:hypothetical protein ABZP36_011424 [Zizania latifolia]